MKVCTDRYTKPKDEVLDWCVDTTMDASFFGQLFVEILILTIVFFTMKKIFSKYNRWKVARKALNRGGNNKKVWPPES